MGEAILKNNSKNIILFDGVCNLCNSFVQFIIKRDKEEVFHFANLHSDFAQKLIRQHPELKKVDAVIFLDKNHIYIKSNAALQIAKSLNGWKWTSVLRIFPLFLRDFIYDLIAKQRYNLFGKKDQCMIPTPELKSRFIS